MGGCTQPSSWLHSVFNSFVNYTYYTCTFFLLLYHVFAFPFLGPAFYQVIIPSSTEEVLFVHTRCVIYMYASNSSTSNAFLPFFSFSGLPLPVCSLMSHAQTFSACYLFAYIFLILIIFITTISWLSCLRCRGRAAREVCSSFMR